MENKNLIQILNQSYPFTCHTIEPLQENVIKLETSNGSFILKKKIDKNQIDRDTLLLNQLNRHHVITSQPIETNNGNYEFYYQDELYLLHTYIEGDVVRDIFQIKDKASLLRQYGETLAKLHLGLIECLDHVSYQEAKTYDILMNYGKTVINEHYDLKQVAYLFDYIKDHQNNYQNLPTQLIHRDYHTNNIIVKDEQVKGVIDFDISVYTVRLFDIAYLLTSILSGCFDDEKKRVQWKNMFQPYLQGYHHICPLTTEELKSMKMMMLIIQLTFVFYFFDHKQYALAEQNIKIAKWIYKQTFSFEFI